MKVASSREEGADVSTQARPTAAHAGKGIEVSVVIPVRNEEQSLPSLIASLQAQTFPPAEVVIVDGGSTDETVALAHRLTRGDARFRIIEAGEATPGRGRNVGTSAARSEWIAYTDAGNGVEPTWLERLAREVESDPSVEVVYGNYEPVTASPVERAVALTYTAPKQERPGGRMRGPFIASSLMRRYVWQRVGGFPDWRAAEDLVFMERVEAAQFRTGWATQATVWWHLPPTLGHVFSKFVLYSRHNVWAGRQRRWHYGVARNYLLGLLFVVLAFLHSPYWLIFPVVGTLARIAKGLWARREGRGLGWMLNPAQFLVVTVVLLAMDVATFVGWTQATLLGRWYPRPTGHASTAAAE
jgi:glycosyltransferase involved in cell wall biosynthesis